MQRAESSFAGLARPRRLSTSQKSQAAESFGAEGKAISAAKRLIDTKNERYRALTSVKSQINRYWKESSLAYPEPGIRLIKQDCIDEFNRVLRGYEEELKDGVRHLDDHFVELKDAASRRLGSLFDTSDYPITLADEFAVEWDFPNITAPDYLRRLNPEVYQQQADLVAQRFESDGRDG